MTVPTLCKHCAVPTEAGDVCTFCRHYAGPPITDSSLTGPGKDDAQAHTPLVDHIVAALADGYTTATEAAERITEMIGALPGDVPLWSVVDLTGAAAHMRASARLIDRAATRITVGEAK